MISIIIPIYNSERTIISLLDSIFSSMYLPFEVICVNDGSTDATVEHVMTYKKNHSQVILINQKNKGVSAARNRGIVEASGDWIMFADSDDNYIDAGLTLLQKEITNNPTAEVFIFRYAEILQCKREVIGINQNICLPVKEYLEKSYSGSDYLYMHAVWNKVYRSKIIALTGYMDEDINLGEDAIFNARYFSLIKSVNVCSTPIYNYIIGGGDALSR